MKWKSTLEDQPQDNSRIVLLLPNGKVCSAHYIDEKTQIEYIDNLELFACVFSDDDTKWIYHKEL